MAARKLNLGCGADIRPRSEGWVNADIAAVPGVDVRFDGFRVPWPLRDGSVDEVFCSHVLEHVPHHIGSQDGLIALLEEMHRVLRPGGRVVALLPIYHGPLYWADPTHRRVLTEHTFRYFTPETTHPWYSTARFRIARVRREAPQPLWPEVLRVRGLGVMVHLWDRFPWLRWLLPRRRSQLRIELERL